MQVKIRTGLLIPCSCIGGNLFVNERIGHNLFVNEGVGHNLLF